eukprot:GHVR01052962.1.p1 GENE.GHVR01052962.1~~GHVR01052962.1.p1  ORF type:complete len:126 (+),score=50.65 GHVR01052962.1:30-407(+)
MSTTRVRQLIGEWCNELEDIHHNINILKGTLLKSNGHTHTHKQPVIEYLPNTGMMKYNSLNTLTTHTHMPHTHHTHIPTDPFNRPHDSKWCDVHNNFDHCHYTRNQDSNETAIAALLLATRCRLF